jgi:N-acyl-D-amino-acid deacylase
MQACSHETWYQIMAILIKNGTIIDGTNTNSYLGDIFVDNKRIAAIGNSEFFDKVIPLDVTVIDAKGYIVSPGFIDTHSHSDLKVLTEPDVEPKLMQGITMEVLGQDGISMAPLPTQYISAWRKNLAGLDGESDEINWEYETTKNYLSMIEQVKPAVNESYLLPHGNVRMEAMGLDDREPKEEEIKKMCDVTRREMQSGCLGLSSGLIYMPCAYSKTKEIIEICKVVNEFDGVFVVHQRSEADTIVSSMKEIIQIGRESGIRIHFSHFKLCGKKNWKYLDEMFDLLDGAKKEGIQVSFDQYPYVAGSTMLSVILPPWVHDGGTDKLVDRLKSQELREKMKQDMKDGIPGWDNFIDFAGVEGIYITSVASDKNKAAIGLSLQQLGELKNKEPLEATFDLLMEEQNAVGMVDFYGLEDHVIKIMKRDEMNVCTDGLLAGTPHPRVYGSFARVLGKYVREEKVIGLEEAVYKMTGKAANALNIKERGFLKVGYYADITIWNPDTIIDKGTFENPKQFPEGIEYVIVNGETAVEHAKYTKKRNGMVIRTS